MFESSQVKKQRIKIMMRIELDDGSERLMFMFVAPNTRVSDTINDTREFLPFENAHGETEIINKHHIRRIVPMEGQAQAGRGPYDVLGIDESASDEEVKAAYRKAIAATHPDNIQSLNLPPDFVELATRKAAQANEAYARIKKLRGKAED
ncbi:DnaJ-like protein [Dongia mobilis]|uniref:DnaJ-like protein n=1 Tax=Dongia mobilis TaxID=578943 RepID=A0A4R6WVH4_9PROT|nr:DnaJ domain-containing protein [Dongia mobilis]TDQ84180.1 DnaJ-like protein [Dongia mobilis]